MSTEFLWNDFSQNWLEYSLETLVANTSDELRLIQEFESEFWSEMQLQLTAEFQLIFVVLITKSIFSYVTR